MSIRIAPIFLTGTLYTLLGMHVPNVHAMSLIKTFIRSVPVNIALTGLTIWAARLILAHRHNNMQISIDYRQDGTLHIVSDRPVTIIGDTQNSIEVTTITKHHAIGLRNILPWFFDPTYQQIKDTHLTVPAQTPLLVETRDYLPRHFPRMPFITIQNMESTISATAASGDIKITDAKGPVTVATGSGNIILERFSGPIHADNFKHITAKAAPDNSKPKLFIYQSKDPVSSIHFQDQTFQY